MPRNNNLVQPDTWQKWDLIEGGEARWIWTPAKFANNGNQWPDGNSNVERSWNDLIGSFPDLRILPSNPFAGIRVGEPYSGSYTEHLDKFTLVTKTAGYTFNFE